MRIVALTGMLGYGYSEVGLNNALAAKPDVIGVDAGSTDPGPYYLGSGKSFTDRNAVKRDLLLALPEAIQRKIPFIIGSAGGSGAKPHVDWLLAIINEIAEERSLSFRTAVIYSDVENGIVAHCYEEGRVRSMGPLETSKDAILASNRIVAQQSVAPVMEALRQKADVIICGRLCDTAIYAAPALLAGYDAGLAFHMAKIMECGSMCSQPLSASDVMLGEIFEDCFVLTPMNPMRRCTVQRVAAHTMYEQTDPLHIVEPDGVADLTESVYQQIDERSVRVSGSRWIPSEQSTLKLEGTCLAGYRTICVAGIFDPDTMAAMDEIEIGVREFVKENLKSILTEDYSLQIRKFGPNIEDLYKGYTGNMGIVLEVVGKTEDIANTVCAVARSRMLHYDYKGRKSTAGNLALPYSPSDIGMGAVYEFSLYHLCLVDAKELGCKTEWREYHYGKIN